PSAAATRTAVPAELEHGRGWAYSWETRARTGARHRCLRVRTMTEKANRVRLARWQPRLPNTRSLAWVVGGVVLLGVLCASEFNYRLMQRELLARAHADALGFASALRSGLERELNADLYLSSGLASYLAVRHASIDPVEVEAILAHLFRSSRHVRNLAVAVDYR